MLLVLASVVFIFYSLTFETSLFVGSYDSQGHGGGIGPHLAMGDSNVIAAGPRYISSARTAQRTPSPAVPPLLCARLLPPLSNNDHCLHGYYLATAVL
jgi:hypothetical protein